MQLSVSLQHLLPHWFVALQVPASTFGVLASGPSTTAGPGQPVDAKVIHATTSIFWRVLMFPCSFVGDEPALHCRWEEKNAAEGYSLGNRREQPR